MALAPVATLCVVALLKSAFAEDVAGGALRGTRPSQLVGDAEIVDLVELPDDALPLNHPGPYDEEPNDIDANAPKHSAQNGSFTNVNSTLSEASFCSVHKTGYWCKALTRIRCCKLQQEQGYAQCGLTVNASSCGWQRVIEKDIQNSSNDTLSSSWWPPYGGSKIEEPTFLQAGCSAKGQSCDDSTKKCCAGKDACRRRNKAAPVKCSK